MSAIILCSPSSIFSADLFVGRLLPFFAQNTTCFEKHVYAFVDFLGKFLVKCLESPETFVEIPQKLEVSNWTKPFSIAEETLDNENLLL
jgi:hypothetical protein